MEKSRIKLIIAQQRRDELRDKIYQCMLIGLISVFIWQVGAFILTPTTITIVNPVSADMVQAVSPADKDNASELSLGYQGNGAIQTPDVVDMIRKSFPNAPELAVAVAQSESKLDVSAESWCDRTKDNRAFSIGIFQINISVHELEGVKCYEAFNGKNKKAVVINEELYQKCIQMAKNPEISIKKAKQIYDQSGSFKQWGGFTSGGYKKFL